MLDAGPPPSADRYVVVAGNRYDASSRKRTPKLLEVLGNGEVARLWSLLTDWDPRDSGDNAFMEPVQLTICFMQSRVPVLSVGLKSRSVTSDKWGSRDVLLRTTALADWLHTHGIELAVGWRELPRRPAAASA